MDNLSCSCQSKSRAYTLLLRRAPGNSLHSFDSVPPPALSFRESIKQWNSSRFHLEGNFCSSCRDELGYGLLGTDSATGSLSLSSASFSLATTFSTPPWQLPLLCLVLLRLLLRLDFIADSLQETIDVAGLVGTHDTDKLIRESMLCNNEAPWEVFALCFFHLLTLERQDDPGLRL